MARPPVNIDKGRGSVVGPETEKAGTLDFNLKYVTLAPFTQFDSNDERIAGEVLTIIPGPSYHPSVVDRLIGHLRQLRDRDTDQ